MAAGCPPSRILTLWKASVLPHFLLHLRYIHDEALVSELQVALTRSLETCLHVYGEKTAILAETGIPPLHYTQQAQLAQFRYRLSSRTSNVIPHVLWARLASTTDQLPRASLDRRMRVATLYLDPDRAPVDCAMPPSVAHAKPPNREKCYLRFLQARVSSKWVQLMRQEHENSLALSTPSRYTTYIGLHLRDLEKRTSAYKPAHYLRSEHPAQLELLRLRAQAWVRMLPCHQWFPLGGAQPRRDYRDRHCPLCLSVGVYLGDEIHMVIDCPNSNGILFRYADKFKMINRRLDLPPFARLTHLQQLQFALGNPSPQLLKKDYKLWMEVAVPLCAEFAGELRRHLESLISSVPAQKFACRRRKKRARKTASAGASHPSSSARKSGTLAGSRAKAPVTESDDEAPQSSDINSESDDTSPDLGESEYSSSDGDDPDAVLSSARSDSNQLSIPPGFSIADSAFLSDDHFAIRNDNPAADSLVNRYIMYRWARVGWCVGLITARHSRKLARHQTSKGYANFVVYYDCDKTEAHHTLCFDSYNDDEVATSPVSTWVLLDRGAQATPGPPQSTH